MYLVDLSRPVSGIDDLSELYGTTDGVWSECADGMEPTESMWVFCSNVYREERTWPVPMVVADRVRERTDLVLKNVVTRHSTFREGGDLANAYEEILFLVKDRREYRFRKDAIRVEHVYEGNDWGERESGTSAYHDTEVRRYNPGGKDPGNVWLEEDRSETSGESVDTTHPLPRSEAVRRCVRAATEEGAAVRTLWADDETHRVIESEGRHAEVVRE